MDQQTRVGSTAALLAVGLMAFGPSIVKLSDLPEMTFVLWRLLFGALGYAIVLVATGQHFGWMELRRSVLGGLIFGVNLVFFMVSMRRTSAANAVVIGALQPVILLGVAARMFGERPHRSLYGWSAVSIGGVALAMYASSGVGVATRTGDLLALVTMLLFSLYYVVSKRARSELEAVPYQLGLTIVAALTILPAALIVGHPISPPVGSDWWPVVLMAVVPGTGHLLTNFAHAHVSLPVMGLIGLLFTAIAPLYAWWLIGEKIGGLQAVGMAVVVAALAVVITRPVDQVTT
ncbi:MAG: DMT family transporter [Actinobacteria bacterium]|jgi:drug/metabolite transporter (DMT)-like permease|nr:DMT family transporter [Actinomycetota bacterium]MBT4037556.1 DMT family transporter [Actinomycetota bacterium]MBT4279856.1 DMT family transporter [Actinomycetota bacterium]MBT4342597.1 DMT family transporter [Actinomycetota bacterium]MBT4786889.1 DMT family transporter [Actinomycetota bacterium]